MGCTSSIVVSPLSRTVLVKVLEERLNDCFLRFHSVFCVAIVGFDCTDGSYIFSCLCFSLLHPDNREVGVKLGIATGLMFTLPLLVFYIALYLFRERAEPLNWAAGCAILTVNLIVGGYCYQAYWEDMDDDSQKKALDEAGPRVGVFKQRTD